MEQNKKIYLSYILDKNTPSYGNRNTFLSEKKYDISQGDVANDTSINTTVHIGTHIDMPYHFFENGQTIENFDIDYFSFNNILFIDMRPDNIIIHHDLIQELEKINNKKSYDILIVKTGICHKRNLNEFWETNYGFHPDVAFYIREYFPQIRVIGFDSISVSSFANRLLGREAHKAFLDPSAPILLLEDMDLTTLTPKSKLLKLEIAPLRISHCDGLPCTIIAKVE